MNNSKQPAFPVTKEVCDFSKIEGYPYGLTKREHIAALMLQGILASGFQTTIEKNVESAIEHTDELLKQLEN